MGKIEMDLSEYDKMQENKRLLEASLDKERSLGDRIKELEEEKRKALEDSAHKVTKITKTVLEEHTVGVIDSRGIVRSGIDHQQTFMNILSTAADVLKNRSQSRPVDAAHDFLRRHLFKTIVSESVQDEYVDTSQSIKDLEREIAKKEYEKATEKVQAEINERSRLKKRISDLVKNKKGLERQIDALKVDNNSKVGFETSIQDLKDKNKELLSENLVVNDLLDSYNKDIVSLKSIVSKNYGLFGSKNKIADIVAFCNKKFKD
jgi:hypothetical protein